MQHESREARHFSTLPLVGDFGAEVKSSAQHRETDMIKNTQRAQREHRLAQDPNIPMEQVRVYLLSFSHDFSLHVKKKINNCTGAERH